MERLIRHATMTSLSLLTFTASHIYAQDQANAVCTRADLMAATALYTAIR